MEALLTVVVLRPDPLPNALPTGPTLDRAREEAEEFTPATPPPLPPTEEPPEPFVPCPPTLVCLLMEAAAAVVAFFPDITRSEV
jgi:hypothetical protein